MDIEVLVFATNQYYKSPYELIFSYVYNNNFENIFQKSDLTILECDKYDKHLRFLFLKDIELRAKKFLCADAIILFFDLECVDSPDKANNIISYINTKCNAGSFNFCIGKCDTEQEKIALYTRENMDMMLNSETVKFDYDEIAIQNNASLYPLLEKIIEKVIEEKKLCPFDSIGTYSELSHQDKCKEKDDADDECDSCIIY